MAKKMIGWTVPWKPSAESSCWAEDGEAAHAGDGDEEVGPDQRPAGEDPGAGSETLARIGVHRAGAVSDRLANWFRPNTTKSSMSGAEGVGQPGALARAGEGQRDDQHCGHGGRDRPPPTGRTGRGGPARSVRRPGSPARAGASFVPAVVVIVSCTPFAGSVWRARLCRNCWLLARIGEGDQCGRDRQSGKDWSSRRRSS